MNIPRRPTRCRTGRMGVSSLSGEAIDGHRDASPSDEESQPPTGSSRKTFVTCDGRTSLTSNVVVASVASFLREKVFPVVGDHCLINLHWDGTDLSTLHIRSIVPDHFILTPRPDHEDVTTERTQHAASVIRDQQHTVPHPTQPANITIKEEPLDETEKTDEFIISYQTVKREVEISDPDDDRSSEHKRCQPMMDRSVLRFDNRTDTTHHLYDGLLLDVDKDSPPEGRRAPLAADPASSTRSEHLSRMNTCSMMYHHHHQQQQLPLPQSPLIPMIPLMALSSQSQLSLQQVGPVLLTPMQSMPQPMSTAFQGMPQMMQAATYGHHIIQSSYGFHHLGTPTLAQTSHQMTAADASMVLHRNGMFM